MKISTASTITLMAAGAEALIGGKKPPVMPDPHVVDGFAWSDPFSSTSIASFEASCQATSTFPASEYTLVDLTEPAPKGLKPWSEGLKKFFTGREYPGGWSGIDVHGPSRSLLMMEYKDVPLEVKEWIEGRGSEDDEGKALFAVFDKPTEASEKVENIVDFSSPADRALDESKIMVFAPGAIYHILPLWAAGGSDCKGTSARLLFHQTLWALTNSRDRQAGRPK